MSTHFLFNITNEVIVYLQPFESCDILDVYPNDTQIIVTNEFVGELCDFHKIEINGQQGYAKIIDVQKLENTKSFAPFVCGDLLPNYAFRFPDWTKMQDGEVFFDEKNLSYNTVVRVCYQTTGTQTRFKKIKDDAVCKAVNKILTTLGKESTKEKIDQYVNYFNFARFLDYYLPIRPLSRIKCLVSIDKKYIDAIPNVTVGDNPNIDKTFTLKLSEIDEKITYVSDLIDSYVQEAEINLVSFTYSYTTPTFNTKTDVYSLGDYSNFRPNIKNGITLKLRKKSSNLRQVPSIIRQALNNNGYSSNNSNDFVEIAINDKCNKIYDIRFNRNGVCKEITRFRYKWINSPILQDPTVVNFLKNLNKLYEIERCSVALSDFCNLYVYPVVKLNFSSVPLNEKPSYSTLEEIEQINNFLKNIEKKYNSYVYNSEDQYKQSLADLKAAAAVYKNFSNNFFVSTGASEFDYSNINEAKNEIINKNPNEIHHEEPDPPTADTKLAVYKSLSDAYGLLKKLGGLCKLTDTGFACLASILSTLDLNATITLSVVKTFSLEEMKDKIIPNIDQQQQREMLNSVIDSSCITKEKMIFLFKNNLDIEQFNSLSLENKSYQDVKTLLISYMLE